ncbi:hypothetical protein GPECTOR_2g1202 [Gonium pectorale]|uniref:Uncharacterized protein n=1 Tax=Gonium pectorale TaxID=33097 RepID=A0A150H0Z4_GONPE|nr:hypothetical protein GPECTOR_2g1202 [Gonium pectorale]|eukprot:KXZ55652.1 hypothetical protein GPECTOR_2g1202 [Gonium pectorale]
MSAELLGPVGANAAEGYAIALQERALLPRKMVPAAAANLLAAQHRDSQRYALVRSGKYKPPALDFIPGDYVYVRWSTVNNTLEMPVHDEVLQVERVGLLGVVVLIGRDGVRLKR